MTRGADQAPVRPERNGTFRLHFRRPAGCAATLLAGGALALATQSAWAQYEPGASNPLSVPGAAGSVPVAPGTVAQQPLSRQSEFIPTLAIDATITSNANFDRVRTDKQPDFVTQITPGFRVTEYGANSSLVGTVNIPMLFYARTGGDNNRVLPDVSLLGTLNGWDKHLALEAGAEVHRQFLTPLGARPSSAVSNTLNEYSSGTYHVSPALRGDLPGQMHYDVHDNNTWTNIQGAPGTLDDAYTNEAAASLSRDPVPFGGGLEYTHSRVTFTGGQSPALATEIARVRGDYAPDPQLRLSASVGHENNNYSFATYSDAIYGFGVRYRPSERTSADAAWEHRFFGSSWHVALDTRTPLTVWSFKSSRDVTTYPQQLATFGVGQDIGTYLNNLFSSRIPDPVARQQAVDALIRLYGLPSTITAPIQLYSQQARLVTDTRAIAGFVGSRNAVYFTVYRNRNQQVVQTGEAAGVVLPFDDVIQTGANLTWSSRLSSITTLTGVLDYLHSTGTSNSLNDARTDNGTASLIVSTPISALTDFHYGVRYQYTRSNVGVSTDEAAVFAGILHRFR
jgi:uncharacterized protein (PEP-CTERM system associated)